MPAAIMSLPAVKPVVARASAARRAGKASGASVARPSAVTSLNRRATTARAGRSQSAVVAVFGDDKPGLKREDEPEEYWQSEGEKAGKSPLKDPLAISAIIGIIVPFVILGVAFATGVIEVPSR
mmetsp:Transcript_33601/g.106862  ORF Transcript_33601/g.106862 Transcript_33601/m.106862 type:complete len:124 (+) Transcript_33601:151-522(+)|eukprot:CAMPEP_0182893694 /NCGR_PEP_ID=MMETSP0034_2-20130328/24634_1 /TAXON_ID=156128 /ORGANISM="Nephroselmis pyriformis, Strain CCMP717" /LENGTH=123 /DNA_ID=CAMNT_0025027453 /DNA_START=119 /DNA_END=490 /DNA_ORIENTATION=+